MTQYSPAITKLLAQHAIEIGNHISVCTDSLCYEGILMPNTGDPDVLVIKLENGYNVGISPAGAEIKKLDGKIPRQIGTSPQQLSKHPEIIRRLYSLPSHTPNNPPIALISTGGTITSKVDYATGAVKSLMTPAEFLEKIPELASIAAINISQPFTKMSEDMDPQDWAQLAQEVAKQLNAGAIGAIVTHGTDTLHYTAAALSFMLKTPKPVILVGSQRSSDRGSSDAAMNLICAAHLAKSTIAEVGTCMHATMNDDSCLFIRGTKVRKMHASRRDAFRPINEAPLAKVLPSGAIEIMNSRHTTRSSGTAVADTKFEPHIALLKVFPGADPALLEYAANHYKGVVLEATGFGHVPTQARVPWISMIKKIGDRIPIVIATQTIYGRVNTNVYTNLRILFTETNAIPAEDMHPETAFVKLGFVLGHEKQLDAIKKMMLTNLAGEFSPRDGDEFLN